MPQPSPRYRKYVQAIGLVLNAYFGFYHRLHIDGAEHIPPHGPLFFTINHVSLLEPFAAGAAVIRHGVLPGIHVWTVSKKELFSIPPVTWFLKKLGMFPVDRVGTDLAAMRTILGILRNKGMIAVAPEGTRSPAGRLQAFQPVTAKIAITQRVPIVPIGAFGTEKALPVGALFPRPHPITVRFGPVYELSEFYHLKLTEAEADRASWIMRAHVAELLPEWMRELPPLAHRPGARKLRDYPPVVLS